MEEQSNLKKYFRITRIYHHVMTTLDLKYAILVYFLVCLAFIYTPLSRYLEEETFLLLVGAGVTTFLYFMMYFSLLAVSFTINASELRKTLIQASYMHNDLELLAERMYRLLWASRILVGLCAVGLILLPIVIFHHGSLSDAVLMGGLIFIGCDLVGMMLWFGDCGKADEAIERLVRVPAFS